MKYRILVLLMLASSFQAKSVQKLSNTELSFILSSMEVLYKNKSFPQIRVIQSWESQTECVVNIKLAQMLGYSYQ